jgi:hypothetical protein
MNTRLRIAYPLAALLLLLAACDSPTDLKLVAVPDVTLEAVGDSNFIQQHISRLRRKLRELGVDDSALGPAAGCVIEVGDARRAGGPALQPRPPRLRRAGLPGRPHGPGLQAVVQRCDDHPHRGRHHLLRGICVSGWWC